MKTQVVDVHSNVQLQCSVIKAIVFCHARRNCLPHCLKPHVVSEMVSERCNFKEKLSSKIFLFDSFKQSINSVLSHVLQ